eukprot:2101167-Alexandrium_andersonii.AAC.1
MSASLVGSEMCIRDSVFVLGPCPYGWGGSVAALPPHREPSELHHPTAVSYTHLTLPTICSV